MIGGSLFSGAGLGDLGWMMAGIDIAWQVEINEYCQQILELRYPESDKYYDIKTFDPKQAKPIDILVGGVPCQAASVAGKQRGSEDDRWLWPEALRIVKEIHPTWVVWENVFGLLSIERGMAFEDICSEMESYGYEVQTFSFTAHSLGASHRRERIWIVAKSKLCGCIHRESKEQPTEGRVNAQCESEPGGEDVADTGQQHGKGNTEGMETDTTKRTDSNIHTKPSSEGQLEDVPNAEAIYAQGFNNRSRKVKAWRSGWREAESRVCRIDDGCANRVDRLKALGNGQVVACTAFIGQQIMEFEKILKGGRF